MAQIQRGPFPPRGGEGSGTMDIPPRRDDVHPRSLPEDRSEGNLNPDPIVACHDCPPGESGEHADWHNPSATHTPSGEPSDDDGAGNPSPRVTENRYGLEDADELDWEPRERRPNV